MSLGEEAPARSRTAAVMDGHWTSDLPRETREALIALHKIDHRQNVRILVYLGLWLSAGALAVSVPWLWVRIPAWLLVGFCLHGLGDFMHMCSHGRVFGAGWVDRVAGFLCGVPVFLSCSNYRASHMLHHRYLNTERDPDCLYASIKVPVLRKAVYYLWMVLGLPIYTVRLTFTGPFVARGLREKAACVAESVAMLSFYSGVASLATSFGLWHVLRDGWLMGLPFAIVIANLRGLAEHTMLDHGDLPDPLHTARTTISNRWVSYFFNNQNYHLEHHLFPAMPWHNLPQANELLQPIYRQTEASVARSYIEYVKDAFHLGPEQGLRYQEGRSYLPDPERPLAISAEGAVGQGGSHGAAWDSSFRGRRAEGGAGRFDPSAPG